MEQQRLLENTLMRWDLDLRCHLSDYHMKPPLSSQDERRILELEKKIKHLGNVDLQAVDRCEVEKKRLSTLIEQKNDLEKALALLKQAMDALDVESEKKFSQSFTQVSEIFTKLYARIFPGGQAQLQLNKDEETGQLGVEIIANPPGKRPTSIHLLSGGEKALTATALVFSLFLVKPSPFCILDEVDAPLDEANVNRFNGLLLDMAPLSQFIVITHNKNTMATASRLYGVTMEQPGQSKIVHVEIEDKRHTAA
jgi:chromosome segregation protein